MGSTLSKKTLWETFKEKIVEHVAAAIILAFASGAALVGGALYLWLKPQKLVAGELIQTIELRTDSAVTTGGSTGVNLSEGVCFLTKVSGRFDATAEAIAVYPNDAGDWVYDFRHGAAVISGRIHCFSHPRLE